MRFKIIVICVLILAVGTAIYLSLDKIIIFTLSKFYGVSISYTALSKDKINGY